MDLPLLPSLGKKIKSRAQTALNIAKPAVKAAAEQLNRKTGLIDAGKAFFADPKKQQEIIGRDMKTDRDLLITGVAVLGMDTGAGKIDDAARAVKTAVTKADDVARTGSQTVTKLIQTIKSAKPIRKEAEALYTAERAKRAAVGSRIMSGVPGEQGYFQALGALKGELPKPKFESPRTQFAQEEVDELFDMVKKRDDLDFFDKINASSGLAKIFGTKDGGIPTDSELKLLQKIYGSELVEAVRSKRPLGEKVMEGVAEVINIPRALMASMDMSAPLRQGRVLISSHPKRGMEAFGQMFKYFGSDQIFKASMEDIMKRPTAGLMKQSGLSLTDITEDAIGLTQKEEGFMTNLAARIPIAGRLVKASERAYVGFLNKMRADVFDDLAQEFQKGGISPEERPEVFKNLANFINTATGRGDLGKFSTAAPLLNGVFFSPRFMASRVQMLNPAWYLKQAPEVRKEAAKSFVKFVGSGIGVLGLAKLGGADVEIDPRSTDFGKIKIGNTRYDTWGGFQQWVRLAAQLATGEVKSSTSGTVRKLDKKEFPHTSRLDQTFNFFVGKFAPIPALVADLMRGQNLVGEPLDWKEETYEKVIPLYLLDIAEAMKENPTALATVGIPAFFGVSTQTYEATKKKSQLPAIPTLPTGSLPSLPKLTPQ